MANLQLSPYIFFRGDAREAMEFYKGVFGGELSMQSYEDVGQPQEGLEGKLMHSSLISDHVTIFACDTKEASAKAAKISLSLMGDDEEKLSKIFDGLKDGGTINQELEKMFWGDTFGSLQDRFGVEWMVNISGRGAAAAPATS